ncbi:unnamed protein product [Acidocella sp. C78]|nr:unnamed protein product [Acidocella sp. C78]
MRLKLTAQPRPDRGLHFRPDEGRGLGRAFFHSSAAPHHLSVR